MNKDLKKKLIVSCAAAALIIPVVGGGTNSTEVKAFDFEGVAHKLVGNFFDYDDDRDDWDDNYENMYGFDFD